MTIDEQKVKLHEDVVLGMHDLYIRKNHDYGDSFEKVRVLYPNAIMIRILDKVNRLGTLLENDAQVISESIDDTLIDLANYAVMELVERKMDAKYLEQYRAKAVCCQDNKTVSVE
jgi:hypothetical protein